MVKPDRKIVSFADPDARFGRKTGTKKFAGYKAHMVEDESGIVTSCETLTGDENKEEKINFQRLPQKEDKLICQKEYISIGKIGQKRYFSSFAAFAIEEKNVLKTGVEQGYM